MLGFRLGECLRGGTVIALSGDLGSGKTTFVQGLAVGLGVPPEIYVTSPSFTLINEYAGRCRLYHVDLYRIQNPLEADDIGLFELINDGGVAVLEWAEKIREKLPPDHLDIQFEIIDDHRRKISMAAHGPETLNLVGLIRKIEKDFKEQP